jgi:hypothetical protein
MSKRILGAPLLVAALYTCGIQMPVRAQALTTQAQIRPAQEPAKSDDAAGKTNTVTQTAPKPTEKIKPDTTGVVQKADIHGRHGHSQSAPVTRAALKMSRDAGAAACSAGRKAHRRSRQAVEDETVIVPAQGSPYLIEFQARSNKRVDLRLNVVREGLDAAFTEWLREERPFAYQSYLHDRGTPR